MATCKQLTQAMPTGLDVGQWVKPHLLQSNLS